MNSNNYFHVCSESVKCKCGWSGCTCKTKIDVRKISDKVSELYNLCPACGSIVLTGTQTTN